MKRKNKKMGTVLIAALTTEKAVRLLESENSLSFIVDRRATKDMIKDEFERLFNIKALRVNTMITPQGKKKAIIKIEGNAMDVATKLGIL